LVCRLVTGCCLNMARRFAGVTGGDSRRARPQNAAGSGGRRGWAIAAGCWLRRTGQPELGRETGPRSRRHDRRRQHAAATRDARSDKQDGSRSLRGQATCFWLRAFLFRGRQAGILVRGQLVRDGLSRQAGCPGTACRSIPLVWLAVMFTEHDRECPSPRCCGVLQWAGAQVLRSRRRRQRCIWSD